MATEKQANQAREEYSDMLRKMGVHAIMVDEIELDGSTSFAVIAMLEKKNYELPDQLELNHGKKKISVPLISRISRKFKPD